MAPRHSDPQFKMRIPPELKERLEEGAKEGGRTLTAEILYRLEGSFSRRFENVDRLNLSMEGRLQSIERNLTHMLKMVARDRENARKIRENPDREHPDGLAWREGFRAFRRQPDAEYSNPFPDGSSEAMSYQDGFSSALFEGINPWTWELLEKYRHILGKRRIGWIESGLNDIPSLPSDEDKKADLS